MAQITTYWQKVIPTSEGNVFVGNVVKYTAECSSLSEYMKSVDAFFDDDGVWVEVRQ